MPRDRNFKFIFIQPTYIGKNENNCTAGGQMADGQYSSMLKPLTRLTWPLRLHDVSLLV